MKEQTIKFSTLKTFLFGILLCISVFLVSCSQPKFNNGDSDSSSSRYAYIEEEDDILSEDASSEEDPQHYAGQNSSAIFDDNDHSSSFSSSSFTVERTPVYVPDVTVNDYMLIQRNVKLDVTYLPQNPELPTGCEITSLTTVLNFYGFTVSKTEMADNYLNKSDTNKDFWSVFLGNPRNFSGFGCYARPITEAANKYLTEQGSNLTAYNYSGADFEQLLVEVENGRPVVIWGTLNMSEPYYSYKWTLDDERTVQWITPEHCLVLIGYDLDRSVAIISDPMKGIVEYDLNTVKSRYIALYSQCVVIQ